MKPLRSWLAAGVLGLAGRSLQAQTPEVRDTIEKEGRAYSTTRDKSGKSSIYVAVQFKITRPDGQLAYNVRKDEIVIEADGRRITDLDIQQPTAQGHLSDALALDVSGSMAGGGKLDQAKQAARIFHDRLQARPDCGLVLFEHQIKQILAPIADPQQLDAHRGRLRSLIDGARPAGGTAYLDAAAEALGMLRGCKGR